MAWLDKILVPYAYVQVFRQRLRVMVPAKNIVIEVTADFSHPRLLLGNFPVAEKALADALKQAYAGHWLPPRPAMVIHPKEVLEGGLAMVEERAFTELGLGAGARQVKIWTGADLDAAALEALWRAG